MLFDYGLTLVHFERPTAAIEAAQATINRCIAGAGHLAPGPATLAAAIHDRVEAEVAAHEAGGALEEIDVAALERAAFADIGLDLEEELRDRCSRIAQEAWFHGIHLYPEVVQVLRSLRDGELRLGLCSNSAYRPASMREQLHHVGLDALVDAAVFSGELGWRKPSPRIFRAALEAVGEAADDTVFVGDRAREDVAGAHRAGMRAVLVQRAGTTGAAAAVDPEKPDAVVSSLAELPPLLLDHPLDDRWKD
ncbi:MAG: HAD family hydrolase [Candidatus Dormibacteraeota bacterium]|uniref:HAD family hydrolase n=1 Tax=Candidatus Amunia macphersoniae TaxID=3127014 RepID=A0A934KFP2_9BACT|nr:HAD family hydrolase [Candidatus Dormibacteraeota bacterium]